MFLSKIQVVNKKNHKETEFDFYCGRPKSGGELGLGNPFTVEELGRDEAIKKYKPYLLNKIQERDEEVIDILNKIVRTSISFPNEIINLVCWCKPEDCHCDFVKWILDFRLNFRTKYYAGIGSRETPEDKLNKIKKIGYVLGKLGYILRSGGAIGADSAFEKGCDLAKGGKEIFYANDCTNDMETMASKFHPNWGACSNYAKKLHGRNCAQILGRSLDAPIGFVVCWTKEGLSKGGTGTVIKLAESHNIPIFNLFNETVFDKI